MFQWRRFQFFEKEEVKDEAALSLVQKLVINCATSGRGQLVLGYADGYLTVVDRDWTVIATFQAYQRSVTHIQQLKNSNILVTVGDDDEEAILPTIKIWNLSKPDKSGNPLCVKSIKIQHSISVTCLVALEDLTQIAVGLVDGTVILIKGDIMREKNSKQIPLKPSADSPSPVTGLGFKENSKSTILFAATTDSIYAYSTGGKDIYLEVLDDAAGCGIGCALMSDEQDMIVGRDEAVYFYEAEGRGPCFAFEGDKKLLYSFRGYLIVVGQDQNNLKLNTLNIYDLKNKFIAYTEGRVQNIAQIVSEWGSIFVFTADGKIYQLEEKDTQTKLETLFKKNLYSVAINLAHSQNLEHSLIIDIFRKYGDHLYMKGDFDGAMTQYLKTIGKLEPSYVIRKFLDAQRIHNLTSYLQALHERGLANADHTTLLFNCYTKLKDNKKLDEFIKTESDLSFEIETAIKACRQAGYYEHALYLAKRHHEHEYYLKILLEDLHNYTEALEYFASLDFFEAEKNLKKYGKVLVTHLPEQTTALLMKLCTNYTPVATATTPNTSAPSTPSVTRPVAPPPTTKMDDEKSLLLAMPVKVEQPMPVPVDDSISPQSTKAKANPDEFIHIYVDQPEWLIKFIEFIVEKGSASNLIYNTLLELYLRDDQIATPGPNNTSHKKVSPEEQKIRRKKALDLLMNPKSKYDDDYAMIISKLHGFRDGLLYLYEKLQLFNEIVEYHMENNEYDNILKSCKRYGTSDKNPNLWVQALSYFAEKKEDCSKEITEVLSNIDRDNLLPPLVVVQILSKKQSATLSLIKDYITRRLHTENQLISEDTKQIKNYREDTKKMRTEIQELKSSAKIFQLNKCTYCSAALDLPAVHFLCMHSFHQRCLGENESECPNCAPQNKKILEIKRSLEENAGQHDQFFKQLEASQDGFNVVSDYFGRGIFNRPVVVPQATASRDLPGNAPPVGRQAPSGRDYYK